MLHNTGQSLVFRPDTGPKHSLAVNVSAGPLAYRYQIEEVFLHYGTDNSHGSEHRIQGNAFPAEVFQFPSGPFGFFLFTKERKKKIIRQKLIKFLGCGAARTQLHTLSRRDKSNRIFGPRDLVRAHKLVSLVEPNVLAGNRRLLVCLRRRRRRSLTRGVGESLCGAVRNSIVLCDAHPITQFRFNSTDTTRNFTPIHQRPGTNHKVS